MGALRAGIRGAQRSGVKVEMPSAVTGALNVFKNRDALSGFANPMTRAEAKKIMNMKEANPSKDAIRDAHRKLLVANHPDKGGSTYVATKINEAKEILLGKKKES